MVKESIKVADEIVTLLGGEKGLTRLGLHSLREFEDGVSAFVIGAIKRGEITDRAVVVIRRVGSNYSVTIQTILPPIRSCQYEVKPKYLRSVLRMELWRRKG